MATEELDAIEPVVEAEVVHVITLEGDLSKDEPPYAACTCAWSTERSDRLLWLGNRAMEHAKETGHILRPH